MTIRKEFLVERQGKTFCLYAGLLAAGHEQGLQSILTALVQVPSEANKNTAICTAKITLLKDGELREFHGIGDAAPNNVAPAMQTCLIRMAETRAKARALRDAVNVGMAAMEEMGGEDDAPDAGYQTRPRQSRQASTNERQPYREHAQALVPARPAARAVAVPAAPLDALAQRWIAGVNAKKWALNHMQTAMGHIVTPDKIGGLSEDDKRNLSIFMDEVDESVKVEA